MCSPSTTPACELPCSSTGSTVTATAKRWARAFVQGKQMWCHMHMSECEARRAYLLDSPDHDEPGACKVIRQE